MSTWRLEVSANGEGWMNLPSIGRPSDRLAVVAERRGGGMLMLTTTQAQKSFLFKRQKRVTRCAWVRESIVAFPSRIRQRKFEDDTAIDCKTGWQGIVQYRTRYRFSSASKDRLACSSKTLLTQDCQQDIWCKTHTSTR